MDNQTMAAFLENAEAASSILVEKAWAILGTMLDLEGLAFRVDKVEYESELVLVHFARHGMQSIVVSMDHEEILRSMNDNS